MWFLGFPILRVSEVFGFGRIFWRFWMLFSSELRFLILYTPMSPSVSNEEHSMMSSDWLRVALLLHTLKPGLHDNFFGTVPVWIWPRCLKISARHPPFLSCKWKNSWHECPKTYGGRDYLSTWSRHSSVLGHSCHEFSHLHDKNDRCRAANFRHRGQI